MTVYDAKTGAPIEANESYAARLVEHGKAVYAPIARYEPPKAAEKAAENAETEAEQTVQADGGKNEKAGEFENAAGGKAKGKRGKE